MQEFPLLIWPATDCLEDMGHSSIVHDEIFGYGDSRQNMLAEKVFEDAQAKGFLPCTFFPSSTAGVVVTHVG